MSASYGLYAHIRANRTRSTILIVGLFLLIYLLVFAFTLAFNGFVMGDEELGTILSETVNQFVWLLPWSTGAGAIWLYGPKRSRGPVGRPLRP